MHIDYTPKKKFKLWLKNTVKAVRNQFFGLKPPEGVSLPKFPRQLARYFIDRQLIRSHLVLYYGQPAFTDKLLNEFQQIAITARSYDEFTGTTVAIIISIQRFERGEDSYKILRDVGVHLSNRQMLLLQEHFDAVTSFPCDLHHNKLTIKPVRTFCDFTASATIPGRASLKWKALVLKTRLWWFSVVK